MEPEELKKKLGHVLSPVGFVQDTLAKFCPNSFVFGKVYLLELQIPWQLALTKNGHNRLH